MFRWIRSNAVLLAMFSLFGCGSSGDIKPIPNLVPVTGTVTFEGKPVAQGSIGFEPVDSSGQPASGKIIKGAFTMNTTASAPGVKVGKYKVIVESSEGGGVVAMPLKGQEPSKPKSLLPEKYGDIKKTDLEANVVKGMAPIKFELKP